MVLRASFVFWAVSADFYNEMSVYSETRFFTPGDKKCYYSKVCGRNPENFCMVIKHKNSVYLCINKIFWLLIKILSFGPVKSKRGFQNMSHAETCMTPGPC